MGGIFKSSWGSLFFYLLCDDVRKGARRWRRSCQSPLKMAVEGFPGCFFERLPRSCCGRDWGDIRTEEISWKTGSLSITPAPLDCQERREQSSPQWLKESVFYYIQNIFFWAYRLLLVYFLIDRRNSPRAHRDCIYFVILILSVSLTFLI